MHNKVKTSWCFINTEVDARVLLLSPFSFCGHGTVQGWLSCMFLWGDLRQRRRSLKKVGNWEQPFQAMPDPSGTKGAGIWLWVTNFSECHPEPGPCSIPGSLASCPSPTSPPLPHSEPWQNCWHGDRCHLWSEELEEFGCLVLKQKIYLCQDKAVVWQ